MPWPGLPLTRRELLAACGSVLMGVAPKPIDMESQSPFRYLNLRTHRMEEMERFYGHTLGLTTRRIGKGIEVSIGPSTLAFSPADPGEKPYYHFAFNITETKFELAQAWLRERTSLVRRNGSETFHFASWNAHATYFFDPGGNIVEFIARHGLRHRPGRSFGLEDVLGISEFGVVAPDVAAVAKAIRSAAGVQDFRPGSEDFQALGTDHGLFIVVREGREWFATEGLEAKTFPATLHWAGGGAKSPYAIAPKTDLHVLGSKA